MNWFSRNAETIEAVAAVFTALVALGALIAVKYQLDAADLQQRAQSAREAYRGHLALAVATPQFAKPADACALSSGREAGSYTAFVDHLLYSAEQMLSVEPGWEATFNEALSPHASYFCSDVATDYTPELNRLLQQFRGRQCSQVKACE